jgi:hypothetical protein
MNFFDVNSEAGDPSFTSPAAAINAMGLPAHHGQRRYGNL